MSRTTPDAAPLVCCVCGEVDAAPWRSSGDNLLGGGETWRAVRCVRCGTRRLDPRPPAEQMARFYAPETYARAEEPGSEVGRRLDAYNDRLAARADKSIPPYRPAGARRVLDVGCGDGRFLLAMQQRAWEEIGTETDPVAADYARRRTGGSVFEATLDEIPLPPEDLDLVTMLHVLEHVPDPRQTLGDALRLLRPGGALLVAVPNADSLEARLFGSSWYHLDLPRHLWGFTPGSLTRLAEEVGFAVRSLTYTPFLFAPQSAFNAVRALRRVAQQEVEGAASDAPTEHPGGSVGAPLAAPIPSPPRGRGGRLQTRAFLSLLPLTERLGRALPGEIMELAAYKPGGAS